jgi:prepilin-type N-terminal cleavage/methylation domain-containing protein
MKKTNRKSGFTLVELMIVAAIIAILAAIIIPLLAKNRDKAIAADGQNLLGTAASALKVYYVSSGDATPTIAELDALTLSELGKSKYFAVPTVTTTIGANGSSFTYTLTATLRAAVGSFTAGDTLTLSDSTGVPVWDGNVASTANIN